MFGALKTWKIDSRKIKNQFRKEDEISEKKKWKKLKFTS